MQTMGEFATISDSLALMPDPALQRFAMMHKDDPFTLALAVSESNRRKKMRAAQQGVAGMQQQPPVADQEIAQMSAPVMPENVGIGALPAPSMAGMPAGGITGEEEPQAMAGGGMVAFAGGGVLAGTEYEIPGMATSSLGAQSGALNANAARAQYAAALQRLQSYGLRQRQQDPAGYQEAVAAAEAAKSAVNAAEQRTQAWNASRAAQAVNPAEAPAGLLRQSIVPASTPVGPPVSATYPDETVRGSRRDGPAAAASAAPGTRPAPGAGPAPAPAPAPAPGAGAPTLAAATPASAGSLQEQFARILAAQSSADPEAAERQALGLEGVARAQAKAAATKARQEKYADVFKGREERLTKQESELGKRADLNTGLAFLNAGLAIMSTPGSVASAIGKGARVGTEQYAAGLERIQAAKDRAAEARDRLEELKLNRSEMSDKEVEAAEDGILGAQIDARKLAIEGRSLTRGENLKKAERIFDATAANERAAMQERGANARAMAGLQATLTSPDRLAFASALQSTKTKERPQGDPVEAYRKLMEVKREPMTVEKLREAWNDPMKRLQISQDYPNVKTFEDYATIMNVGGGGAGGGGGGFSIVGTRPAQ